MSKLSRRHFIRRSAASGALASIPVLKIWSATGITPLAKKGPARRALSLDRDWLVSRTKSSSAGEPELKASATSSVTLPHCVTPLSWQKWDPASWEDVWTYRRDFEIPPEFKGLRLFLYLQRAMVAATPTVNGHALPRHLGGFLPFDYEITHLVREKTNTLSIAVDSRWANVPPAGSPKGPSSIDYLLPGGISGSVELRAVPHVFIKEVFAKPVDVLTKDRRLEVTCSIDCEQTMPAAIRLVATLRDGSRDIAHASKNFSLAQKNQDVSLTVDELKNVMLWDVEKPHLYDLVVTLFLDGSPLHTCETRIGFREARFELDGFFLNGKRLQLFGLNRHELYPYVGFAAPDRVLRRDAEYLRRDLNCNIVRCSHYPQSKAFLDACDELGLLVWEEIPGWQYIGDKSWQDIALQNVEDMIRRDRNHPSIVIWGVRINESPNDPNLYRRTREIAKSLDDSRPTSGSMTPSSTKDWRESWKEDVFAFDDYHAAPDGSVGIDAPLPGVPYMIAEAVGQYDYGTSKSFNRKYRKAGNPTEQMQQALLHAQAHSKGAASSHCAGVIAWCAFDYASLMNAYATVKCPGIVDTFRIPKLGASFYLAQIDPRVRPVIEPSFYWDFGPRTPAGPGKRAAIFSNCDRLDIFIDGKFHATVLPDAKNLPNIKYPPFFVDLSVAGAGKPELRIDGYLGSRLLLSRSFSSDNTTDQLSLHSDNTELQADGSDATRVAFGTVDRFGAPRPFAEGEVSLQLKGPGLIVGDNPFHLADSGGVGAIWIKSLPNRTGRIVLTASHSSLGRNSLSITVRRSPV